MKSDWFSFNLYLALLAGLACATGCQSARDENKKEYSTLRLYIETNLDGTERTMQVPVFREKPMLVSVHRSEFLTEGDIREAAVVETLGGGFAIRLEYDRHGAWMLENITTAHRGARIAIHSQFGQARWLAAPLIQTPIRDGVLVFTPDADRQEADRIVHGLSNVVARVRKTTRFQ